MIIAGILCGIAGAFISTSLSASFVQRHDGGPGFIALAALIFANWRAWPALYACLLFGFLQAGGNTCKAFALPGLWKCRCSSSSCRPMC